MAGSWVEIALPVTEALADEVAAQLAMSVDAASAGVWIKDREVVFWVAEAGLPVAVAEARTFAARHSDWIPGEVIVRSAAPEAEWRDAWKRYFRTTRITRQLVIVPSWDRFDPGLEDVVLDLDPGRAFGTGDHASTKLVLTALQTLHDDGAQPSRILDVGTGSGILAIAAAKFWPHSNGLAIDIDPEAVACAAENLRQNAVYDRYPPSATPLEQVEGPFDLILANIQADVLTAMAETLSARLRRGGTLILSGLLTEQVDDVRQAFSKLRCSWLQADVADPQWSGLALSMSSL